MSEPDDGSSPCKISRQERYCLARMTGMGITEAHRHVGYTGKNTWQTESMPSVKLRLGWLQTQLAERTIEANTVTRIEVIEEFRDILKMAKKGTELVGRNGEATGVYKPDLSSANKANEGLAKMHGFMVDVTRTETLDEELDGKNSEELQAYVLSLLEQLDPNMRKTLLAQMDTPAIDMSTIGDGETMQ